MHRDMQPKVYSIVLVNMDRQEPFKVNFKRGSRCFFALLFLDMTTQRFSRMETDKRF